MADAYLVQIDLPKLRARLIAAEGRELSDTDVRELLADADFNPTARGWIAEEISLGWLNADEILSATPLD